MFETNSVNNEGYIGYMYLHVAFNLQSARTNVNVLNMFNRVQDSKVKLKMAETKYTQEEPRDVAHRIEKGIDCW